MPSLIGVAVHVVVKAAAVFEVVRVLVRDVVFVFVRDFVLVDRAALVLV